MRILSFKILLDSWNEGEGGMWGEGGGVCGRSGRSGTAIVVMRVRGRGVRRSGAKIERLCDIISRQRQDAS